MNKNQPTAVREVDIFDLLLSLSRHKFMIISITCIISLAAVIYTLVVDEKWAATTTFKTVTENDNSSFGASILGLSSSFFEGGVTNSMDHLVTLNSRHFHQHIIDKFNLLEYFDIDEPDPIAKNDKALNLLKYELLSISINNDTQLISITAKTRDRDFSVEIANYCREYLDEYTKKSRLTKSREKRIFLEQRVAAFQDSIKHTALKLKKFQEKNKVSNLEVQAEKILGMYSDLYTEKISLESELAVKNSYMQEGAFEMNVINQKLKIIEQNISNLEKDNKSSAAFSLNQIPSLMYQYASLQLKLKVYTSAFEFLYPQLESARIKEIEDIDSIELVDLAMPAGMRSEPKRAKICIIVFLAAFIFSSLLALLIDSITLEQKEKLNLVIRNLTSKKNDKG